MKKVRAFLSLRNVHTHTYARVRRIGNDRRHVYSRALTCAPFCRAFLEPAFQNYPRDGSTVLFFCSWHTRERFKHSVRLKCGGINHPTLRMLTRNLDRSSGEGDSFDAINSDSVVICGNNQLWIRKYNDCYKFLLFFLLISNKSEGVVKLIKIFFFFLYLKRMFNRRKFNCLLSKSILI